MVGNLTRMIDLNANNDMRKALVADLFPETRKRPFVVFYPKGNVEFKLKNARIWDHSTSYESCLLDISDSIGQGGVEKLSVMNFRGKTEQTFEDNKLLLVLLHDKEVSSISYRLLSSMKRRYGSLLNFYEV